MSGGQNKTFGSKVILRKRYFAIFGADFCHECQICGEKDIYISIQK